MAAKPAGSKKPTGGRAPTRPSGAWAGAFFALGAAFFTARVALREVVAGPCVAGAKAAAPAKRVERMASFMVLE